MPFKIKKIKKNQKSRKKTKKTMLSPGVVKKLKICGVCVITVVLMFIVYRSEQAGIWFKASILDAPQPFSGTVMPVLKVPNYTYWNTQKNLRYEQIPERELVNLPPYNLNKMAFPNDQLIWGDPSHDGIRNVKITYPVVYLGNYKNDHIESVGSHLAVDIKLPIGTPIRAIANGKVVKTSMVSTGFGHHVVIKMSKVPDPDNPGKTTNLYACFNHMDRIDVKEGQNVLKGEIIGTSGNTGTSTTPHLHFQIDNDKAPWHPYWPFTWQESQSAGLSFFEAVNAGLGLNKAKKYTVNPMEFVTKHLNYNMSAGSGGGTAEDEDMTSDDPETQPEIQPEPQPEAQPETQPESQPEPQPEAQPEFTDTGGVASLFTYKITGEKVSLAGNGITLIVTDENNQIKKLNDSDVIKAEITGVGRLLKKQFKKSDFVNNTLKVVVISDEEGAANITLGKSSYQVSFVSQLKPVAKFHIETDEKFQKNIVENVKIIALDEDGNIAPAVNFSGVVGITINKGTSRITPDNLESKDFKGGVAEVQVVIFSDDPVTIKAQNGALIGESAPIHQEETNVFSDIPRTSSYYNSIKYLKENDIINGYPDGTFKPNQTVNRAEALKMLMLAFNVDVGGPFEINFNDVDKSAWYAPTLSTGVARGIVQGYNDGTFRPANTVNRAEYLKILFATNSMDPNTNITKPYDDVELTDWFAGYAFMANKMNLVDAKNNLRPAEGMTRAEVAETIYRMKMIQANNLLTYSK